MKSRLYAAAVLLTVPLLALAVAASGCTSGQLPTPAEVRQVYDQAKQEKSELQAELDQVTAAAATQPADSPAAQDLHKSIDAIQARLNQLDKVIPAADALIRSYEQGSPDASLVGALGGLFGPWGAAAGGAVLIGFGMYQRIQNSRNAAALQQTTIALRQTVQGLDAAGGLTEAQKAAVAAAQDETSKALVDEHRLTPGDPPTPSDHQ